MKFSLTPPPESVAFYREAYTHVGWFLFCPVYFNFSPGREAVGVRHFVPELLLDLAMLVWAINDRVRPLIGLRRFGDMTPILETGPLPSWGAP